MAGPTPASRAISGPLPVLLALVLVAVLTGCSGTTAAVPGPPPAQKTERGTVLRPGTQTTAATLRAMRAVGAVRIHGYVVYQGELVEIDLRRDDQRRCRGSVEGDDDKAIVVLTEDVVYVHGNKAYWSAGKDTPPAWFVRQAQDRWVSFPAALLDDLGRLCDLDRLLTWKPREAFRTWITSAQDTSYAGQPAIELRYHDLKLIVEAEAPHRVLGMLGGPVANDVRFTNYGSVTPIKIPPDVLDVRRMRPY